VPNPCLFKTAAAISPVFQKGCGMRALFTSFLWFFALVAAPVLAQDAVPSSNAVIRGTYGDWQMRCETVTTAAGEQCLLTQSVMAKDRPNVGLVVIAGRVGPEKIEILRVVAPLGVLLPMGLGLRIDDQVIGAMDFVRCTPAACIAEARLATNDLLKKIKAGKTANFVLFLTPDEGIGVPVSLNGFATGYDQLK
jgi:invasion protein IalB